MTELCTLFGLSSLRLNLVDSFLVASTFEFGGKPRVNNRDGYVFAQETLADGDHVAVTVLLGESRSLVVPDHRTPDPSDSVCDDCLISAPAWSLAMAMVVFIFFSERSWLGITTEL